MNVRAARSALIGLTVSLSLCAGAPAASADVPIPPENLKLEVLDSAGNPENRAGAHPDRMITKVKIPETGGVPESSKDTVIDFPPGMSGDPGSVPVCPRERFDRANNFFEELIGEIEVCPFQAQVGNLVAIRDSGTSEIPVYNLEPAPGEVAAFGVVNLGLRLKFSGRLRPADFGLTTSLNGLPEFSLEGPVIESYFEFWGVPADHQKVPEGETPAPRRALLTLPTTCDGPLEIGIRERTWEHQNEWYSGVASTGTPLVGCQDLPFSPGIAYQLENPVADTPTGIDIDQTFPQNNDPDGRVNAQLRSARLELPAGMGISLGTASQFNACTDAEFKLGSDEPAVCPHSAKVGTVEIGAAQLAEPLIGRVYIGEERPDARFRLFVVAAGEGIESKFVGAMRPDPVTGRLTTVLSDMPQIPLDHLRMHFDGGPRALLVTPLTCGPTTVTATMTPYSGTPPVTVSGGAMVGPRPGTRCGAPAPFAPSLDIGLSSRRAGRPTSFSTVIGRKDGEQSTSRFSTALPAGLSASLSSVTACPEAAVQAGSCTAASKIGDAFIDIGSGSQTAEVAGDAHLTGPYHGDPFGLAMIFHLNIGPFHLGTFVVRAAMKLDPQTGQVSTQTETLPQTFEGVPIRFQRISLDINRPGFLTAPTSCTPKRVTATIQSTEGVVVHPSREFSVRGCIDLPFKPSLSLALTDRTQLHRHGHPGLRISMRGRKGEANMRSLGLLLPDGVKFSAANLRELCPRAEALKGDCPKGARVGTGFGRTRLLDKSLKGSVYAVQPRGDGEPDLWTNLKGEGTEFNLRSTASTKNGRVANGFEDLPDMPLSLFTMEFAAGKRGFLTLDRDLCIKGKAQRLFAPATFEAHSGAYRQMRIPITTPEICKNG